MLWSCLRPYGLRTQVPNDCKDTRNPLLYPQSRVFIAPSSLQENHLKPPDSLNHNAIADNLPPCNCFAYTYTMYKSNYKSSRHSVCLAGYTLHTVLYQMTNPKSKRIIRRANASSARAVYHPYRLAVINCYLSDHAHGLSIPRVHLQFACPPTRRALQYASYHPNCVCKLSDNQPFYPSQAAHVHTHTRIAKYPGIYKITISSPIGPFLHPIGSRTHL
jgi:hypothetical protein